MEGVVELIEYVNVEYVSRVSITTSVLTAGDTPLMKVEEELLNSARHTLARLAELSAADLRRFLEASRGGDFQETSEDEKPAPTNDFSQGYDATRDPRTGRPPSLLEAQRLAREREEDREQGAEPDSSSTLSEDRSPAPTPPQWAEDEKAAADALVQEGISRERAERLIQAHGANLETLRAAAFAEEQSTFSSHKDELAKHHQSGIPPFEPPERENTD
jgi:hypothetical protein